MVNVELAHSGVSFASMAGCVHNMYIHGEVDHSSLTLHLK